MDEILSKAGSQVVSFAIKSSITLASSFVLKKVTKFVHELPTKNKEDEFKIKRIEKLKRQLENKIIIISNAIDLIKIVAFNGNNNLNGIIQLTHDIKLEIDSIDDRLVELEVEVSKERQPEKGESAIDKIITYIEDVIERLDEITPFINLSLSTSGINLNTALPKSVSPNLLLNASNLINNNNQEYNNKDTTETQFLINKKFVFTIYTVFYKAQVNKVIWKEDYNKSSVQIVRQHEQYNDEDDDGYRYQLIFKEDFDDERYHDEEDEEREIVVNLENVIKIFYSYSGNLLNLETDLDRPVLILKVDNNNLKNTSTQDIIYYGVGNYEEKSESDVKLFELLLRLLALQINEKNDILNVNDEKLSLYLSDENKSMNKFTDNDENTTLMKLQKISI